MITSSQELQRVIDGKTKPDGVIYLANGTYNVQPSDTYRSFKIESADATPYGVRICVHDAPLLIGHFSEIKSVTLQPMGDHAAARLDHSSRAKFFYSIFRSRKQDKRDADVNDHETWDTIEREGIGIETTKENIGDDAWACWVVGCLFQSLQTGIKTTATGLSPIGPKPKPKGTMEWKILHNDFDACKYAFDLVRVGGWNITGGIIQLAQVGIRLDGMSNWIRDVSFERCADKESGGWDIQFSNQSCHNRVRDVTAMPHRVNSVVKNRELNNIYSWVQKRSINRPCETGDNQELAYPD